MDRLVSNEYQKIRYGWKCVTLYIWRSVCIFSILLSVHFLNILTSGIVICNVYLVSKRKGKKLLVVWKMNRMNISLFSCLETLEETRIENRGTFKLPYTVLYSIVGGGGGGFWLCHYKIYLIHPRLSDFLMISPKLANNWQSITMVPSLYSGDDRSPFRPPLKTMWSLKNHPGPPSPGDNK